MHKSGQSPEQIAARDDVPISTGAVRFRLQRAGFLLPDRRKKLDTDKVLAMANQGVPTKQIAESLGATEAAIRYYLRKASGRARVSRYHISSDYLKRLYEDDRLSTTQIAARDDVPLSVNGVTQRLRRAGVQFRDTGAAKRRGRPRPRHDNVGDEELLRLRQQGLSYRKIAEHTGLSYTTVATRMNKAEASHISEK